MQKRTLYIGNLAYTAVEEDLEQAFESFGLIEDIKLMRDIETGRSRGFAFITFEKETEAATAKKMDGKELAGRQIRVNEAKQKKSSQDPARKKQNNSFNNYHCKQTQYSR